jgi:hypothetical protein
MHIHSPPKLFDLEDGESCERDEVPILLVIDCL